MHIINPYMFVPSGPGPHYLVEDFNGPALNADWDGSGGTYTFSSGHIDLTAGAIVSVRNDLDIMNTICTIHTTPGATGDWFLVIGDLSAFTFLIEVRYQPSSGKVRLTQHSGGVDVHHDYTYGAIGDAEWVQLGVTVGNIFELYSSSDGSTFTLRTSTPIDMGFPTSACGVDLSYISGTAQLESFDSIILA